jgi:Peptidase family M41
VHETGHALAALMSSVGAPELAFVSIVPRMNGSLGFTASVPPEGAVMTRTEVRERLRTILAGRAAEEVVYGKSDISLNSGGGQGSDLAVATRTATHVICTSGFGTDGSLHWTSTRSHRCRARRAPGARRCGRSCAAGGIADQGWALNAQQSALTAGRPRVATPRSRPGWTSLPEQQRSDGCSTSGRRCAASSV